MSAPRSKYIALPQLCCVLCFTTNILHNKIHSQFSYMLPVLVFLLRYMFLNSMQCRVFLSVLECIIVLVHSCLQLELGLFPIGIISSAVVLVDEQRMEIELSNSSGHQFQMSLVSFHSKDIIFL